MARLPRRPRASVLASYGLPVSTKLLLHTFGGQDSTTLLGSLASASLPPGWSCITTAASALPGRLPPGFLPAKPGEYIPDLVAAASAVLGKTGYGTVSECLATGTPLVYVPRRHFAEEPFLVRLLDSRGCCLEMSRAAYEAGDWGGALERAVDG